MEKRASERIPVNIETIFSYDDPLYYGIVTNLSKQGMKSYKNSKNESKKIFVFLKGDVQVNRQPYRKRR